MAMTTRGTIVGVFQDREHAREAVNELKQMGFRDDQIGLVTHDWRSNDPDAVVDDGDSQMAEGAVAGLATGASVGALWALGIAAGVLPAIGPIVAGGLLASVLASAAGGAAVGGVLGALIGLGIPEDEAEYYETEFKSGRTLVTVKPEGREAEALAVLRKHGGYEHQYASDFSASSTMASSSMGKADFASASSSSLHQSSAPRTLREGEETIEVKEERLSAHKHPVEGEVRVRKEVTTEHQTLNVPVEREEVVIERRAAHGHVTSDTIKPGEEVRIPVREERVHVGKETVVKEEVSVGKRKIHDTETVSGTVRKEDVKIEKDANVNVDIDTDIKRRK